MNRYWTSLCLLLVFPLVITTTGCDDSVSKGVIVRGKLVKGGAPLKSARPDVGLGWVQIELHPPAGSNISMEMTKPNEVDGSFEFLGPGQGIPPGNYQMVVYHYEQGPPNDSLQGKFAPGVTPLKVDIPADKVGGTHDLGTLDLDRP